jgi:hypothetical protein
MKIFSSALAVSLLVTNSLSFTIPHSRTPKVPSVLSASVTRKNMSEWERWENESKNVNLRPEYRQDDIYFNQRRPVNEYHDNSHRFATTKSKVVDDDPWRKVKVDEYTPTGMNNNRQYQKQNFENVHGDYDRQQVNARQGYQNDIRQNYQTVNNNGYRNQNADYRQVYKGSNHMTGYRQGHQTNQGVYQDYQTRPTYSKDAYRQSNQIDSYRNDIRQHFQPIYNDNSSRKVYGQQNDSRANTGYYDKKANRFEVWEAERVRGRNSDPRSNDHYSDATVRRNGVTSYSQPHHNVLASNGYYNDQDFNYVSNTQTKRFPTYENPNFDPTSNIDPIPGSNSKRISMQPAYSNEDINYYDKKQLKNSYRLHQYPNTYENNISGRNANVGSRKVNSIDYPRSSVGLSSNGRQDYRTDLQGYQNMPYQNNQSFRSTNNYYELNQPMTKRFPSYEQDDDPTCPKEPR